MTLYELSVLEVWGRKDIEVVFEVMSGMDMGQSNHPQVTSSLLGRVLGLKQSSALIN